MAVRVPSHEKTAFIDKAWLKRKFAEMDARSGFVVDPTVTVSQVRDMMLADGIQPEDNEFSRELIRLRYEEE